MVSERDSQLFVIATIKFVYDDYFLGFCNTSSGILANKLPFIVAAQQTIPV